jgi:hypothetical protein
VNWKAGEAVDVSPDEEVLEFRAPVTTEWGHEVGAAYDSMAHEAKKRARLFAAAPEMAWLIEAFVLSYETGGELNETKLRSWAKEFKECAKRARGH